MYSQRRKLSQNFLKSRKQVKILVGRSSIGKKDRVLEIGPGKGQITQQLLQSSGSVSAVEIDLQLVTILKKYFVDNPTFWIFHRDILDFPLPVGNYKVFSNIPFSIEGKIIRKLLDSPNPPQDSYLVIRKELAERLSGIPHENKFSLTHKVNFDFEIIHYFKRSDFEPPTKVHCVLWRAKKLPVPRIPKHTQNAWEQLIENGIGKGESLHKNLLKILDQKEVVEIYRTLNLDPQTKPSYLSLTQWLQIFKLTSKMPTRV